MSRRRRCWDKAAAVFQLVKVISKNEMRTVRQVCLLRWDSCCLSCCFIIIYSAQRSNCTRRLLIMFISLLITNVLFGFVCSWLIDWLIGQFIDCWSRHGLDPFTFCAAPDNGMDPDFHIFFNVLAEVCTLLRADLVYLSDFSTNQMATNQTAYKISKA